jgi:phosphopantothenoylcysteine decarboxylase/phosphopantothenate--cysteine ligase
MQQAVLSAIGDADVLLMAAAVGDYRPDGVAPHKIKKAKTELTLHLVRTSDILSTVTARRTESGYPRVVVGFAAESEDLVQNARTKLEAKQLDLIVANDITAADAGFAAPTNRVALVDRTGDVQELPLMSKSAVADTVVVRVARLLAEVR